MTPSTLLDPFIEWVTASTINKIIFSAALWFLYLAILSVYRLFLSPLSRFPGPKLAAVSGWYALYYDIFYEGGGNYVWEVEAMHQKYGPIVRIKPYTLHINDPEAMDLVFPGGGKRREKADAAINGFATSYAGLGTRDHDLHKMRRAAVNPFFSKQSIRRLEPIIQQCLEKLQKRMEIWGAAGVPAPMNLAYKATTKDIIGDYAFEDLPSALDAPDMNEPFFSVLKGSVSSQITVYFGFIVPIMKMLPLAVVMYLQPILVSFVEYQNELGRQIDRIREAKGDPSGKRTIFHSLLNGSLPDSEKKTERLQEEAYIIVIAGTDTTAATLSALTYHLLSNPNVLKKLRDELETAMPDPNESPTLKVETLPYLAAVVQEAIRLHPGASLRQERVAPDDDVMYETPQGERYQIPKGTAVGMTAPLLNKHPDLYPEPQKFRPERYIENPHLSKYQLAFSKGSRSCLGINLAYQELHLITAGIFRKYDLYDGSGMQKGPTLELYETTREDVDMAHDWATPGLKEGSKGVRLMIRQGRSNQA